MQIVNLTRRDVIRGLESPKIYGKYWGDYYRKFTEFDKDNILGLYYKTLNLKEYGSLDKIIEIAKKCSYGEYNWEFYNMYKLFSLVNRLEEAYKTVERQKTSIIKAPSITGIALYKNFPVGTLFPRELVEYDTLKDVDEPIILKEDVKKLVESLMRQDIYPTLYQGNVRVNPRDYADVRLDGLDGPMICRVESKQYVKTLKRNGRDLRKETMKNLEELFQ